VAGYLASLFDGDKKRDLMKYQIRICFSKSKKGWGCAMMGASTKAAIALIRHF
jgi:hypothetical protein